MRNDSSWEVMKLGTMIYADFLDLCDIEIFFRNKCQNINRQQIPKEQRDEIKTRMGPVRNKVNINT